MSGDILTRWGLVLRLDGAPAGEAFAGEAFAGEASPGEASPGEAPGFRTAEDLFAEARRAYLGRCPVLGAFLASEAALVRVTGRPTTDAPTAVAAGALLAVSVVEIRPSSFDMEARIRPGGEGAGHPIDGRWTVVLERASTGERLPVPREVRDELIAIQLAARDLC